MISHEYKCIFIHIPKCAGTSIEKAFGHLDGHVGRDGQDHRAVRDIQPIRPFPSQKTIIETLRRLKHRYYNKVPNPRNRYAVTKNQYDSYFKFTVVRNPWARVLSWYTAVMHDETTKKALGIKGPVSFNDALVQHMGTGLLRPQLYWITNYDGKIDLDYIGRFENLNEDFKTICNRLNTPHLTLPHTLKGQHRDYREYYDTDSIQAVADYYRDEIAMFGYTFDA